MNKDLDERLIPKGEYIDAMNVEVTSSDDDSIGTVQNLNGNQSIAGNNLIPANSVCVGAITDEATDSLYWLTATDKINTVLDRHAAVSGAPEMRFNAIFEYKNNSISPILVDKHQVVVVAEDFQMYQYQAISNSVFFCNYNLPIHVGMNVICHLSTGAPVNAGIIMELEASSSNAGGVGMGIMVSNGTNAFFDPNLDYIEFTGDITNWNTDTIVTGINIVDDLLFWTDNESEPKKINITRCKEGTFQYTNIANAEHTNLISEGNNKGPIKQSHITVIKEKPNTPVTLEMKGFGGINTGIYGYVEDDGRLGTNPTNNFWEAGDTTYFAAASGNPIQTIDSYSFDGVRKMDLKAGDILLLKYIAGGLSNITGAVTLSDFPIVTHDVRAKIISMGQPSSAPPNNIFAGEMDIQVEILHVNYDNWPSNTPAPSDTLVWAVEKEITTKPLFELKFPRFSYRWKYEDGEYSTFAPWSEIAFLASPLRYLPKEGFNLGMVNNIKELTLYDFVTADIPLDVVQIDLLYKESDSPNIYIVDTLKANDIVPTGLLNNPWNSNGSQENPSGTSYSSIPKGEYKITSETVFATVAPNQLTRNWDNVPKKALAQEIIGNRLVYGNYTKNFNLTPYSSLSFTPDITTLVESFNVNDWKYKSVKSIREYQVGIVYTDKYGRETPVYTNKNGTVSVPKVNSSQSNILYTKINNSLPTEANFYKFYVKETSTKYHNLVMDRWYDAEDGDIWLSFHSHDRDKVDEETFLYLKRGHSGEKVLDDYKYKILSIKNEAPEFIRKTAKQFGIKPDNVANFGLGFTDFAIDTLYNDNGANINAISGNIPMVGQKDFTIIAAVVENSSWENLAINAGPFGTKLKVRFLQYPSSVTATHRGDGQFHYDEDPTKVSAWYKIDKINKSNLNNTDYTVNLAKALENDALFVNPTGTTDPYNAGAIGGYIGIEITEELAENLPEFDGRFFVKVLSNNSTYKHITNSEPTSVVYTQPLYYYDQPLDSATPGVYPAEAGGSVDLELYKDNNAGGYGTPVNSLFVDSDDTNYNTIKAGWAAEFGDGTQLHVTTSGDNPGGAKIFIDKLKYQASHVGSAQYADPLTDGTPGVGNGISGNTIDISVSGAIYNVHEDSWSKENNIAINPFWNSYNYSLNYDWVWFGGDYSDGLYNDVIVSSDSPMAYPITQARYLGGNSFVNTQSDVTNFVDNIRVGASFQFSEDTTNGGEAEVYTITGIELYHRWNYLDENMLLNNSNITTHGTDWWQPGGFGGIDDLAVGFDGIGCTTGPYNTGNCSGNVPNIIHNIQDPTVTANNRRTTYRLTLNKPIGSGGSYNPTTADCTAASAGCSIQFLDHNLSDFYEKTSNTPAIWETEPKEVSDIDIYYQASQSYPTQVTSENISNIFSIGDTLVSNNASINLDATSAGAKIKGFHKNWDGWIQIENINNSGNFLMPNVNSSPALIKIQDQETKSYIQLQVTRADSSIIGNEVWIKIDTNTHNWGRTLKWHNCYSFGNGVESDTIRDDFNQVEIDNGVTASTTVGWSYENERLKNGLIFSGLYNNKTSLNDLNQFIDAENITKDLNPSYGSIQKLHARDSDLVTLCEDKVVKILASKDALFNADENSQLIATNKVLGQAQPFVGDWGISTNPESFAKENFRSYFVDRKRGAVLRLSRDGLTPISEIGMKDWFRDNLSLVTDGQRIHGSYNTHKSLYNITIPGTPYNTISFNENSKGWPSFKSFIPEKGISMNNDYFTFKSGKIYQHHIGNINSFYNNPPVDSSLKFIFNADPSIVKSFTTINYEGTQSRVTQRDNDLEYTNLFSKSGWFVNFLQTDKQEGQVLDFVEKEGKWFNHIMGISGGVDSNRSERLSRIDTREFSFQGIENLTIEARLLGDQLHYSNCDGAGFDSLATNPSVNNPNVLIGCPETFNL